MALGQGIGDQFQFQALPQQGGSPQMGGMGGQAPSIGSEADNLEVVDGLTENYYNAYANLNNMAKSAWKKYGIDVTAPDLSDPSQQRFNRIFLKGLAQVKSLGNELQRGRENQLMKAELAAKQPDFYAPTQEAGTATTTEGFGNLGLTSEDEEVVKYRDKMYNTRGEQRAAQAEVDGYVDSLRGQLEGSTGTDKLALEARINALEAIRPGYKHEPVSASIQKEFAKRKRAGDQNRAASELYSNLRLGAKSGDEEAKQALLSFPRVSDVNIIHSKGDGEGKTIAEITVGTGSNKNIVKVDLDDARQGSRALVQALKEFGKGYEDIDVDTVSSFLTEAEREGRLPQAYSETEKTAINQYVDQKVSTAKKGSWLGGDDSNELVNGLNESISKEGPMRFTFPDGEVVEVTEVEYDASIFGGILGGDEVILRFSDGTSKKLIPNDNKSDEVALDKFMRENVQRVAKEVVVDDSGTEAVVEDSETTLAAVEAFRSQLGRDPSEAELKGIRAKYK